MYRTLAAAVTAWEHFA